MEKNKEIWSPSELTHHAGGIKDPVVSRLYFNEDTASGI